MKTILALRGKANTGKSTTIRILHDLLIQYDFELINSNLANTNGDFIAVFKKNEKLIGLTSSGDLYDFVHDNLVELIDDGCELCICACRTYDRVPPGTNAAVEEFTDFQHQFVEKTYDDNALSQVSTNRNDAQNLLTLIESLI